MYDKMLQNFRIAFIINIRKLNFEVINILLALAGITGIGKSYYKDKICEKLNFSKIKIITTRPPRDNELNNEDKIFVNKEELDKMINEGKIAYQFEMLGNLYAYSKEALYTDKNTVFELHYNTIADFKALCPNLCAIYLLPKDIDVAKNKLRERNLKPQVEQARLLEIDEHYNKIMSDKNLLSMFDYVLYNNYDKESEDTVIDLVKENLIKGEN